MKQVILQSGQVRVDEVPPPQVQVGSVLVAVRASVVSTGTEISGTTTSPLSFLQRVARQPGNIHRGFIMMRRQGVLHTLRIVQGIARAAQPTGYSAAGEVIETGDGVDDIRCGDRVACAGAGIANHAEVIVVPRNLVVKISEKVSFEDAASGTIGAIALQGVRRADPHIGEVVAVIGLGLIGQLTVQILKAAGCAVIGIDVDSSRIAKAKEHGCDTALGTDQGVQAAVESITDGHGVDATIITAASESSAPVKTAMEITRRKGRVVVVGAVGLHLDRSPFYEKEIDFLISCSYGPGRYDPSYEEGGLDYPYGYVRWTENRNMQAYLALLERNAVQFRQLIDRTFSIHDAQAAYRYLQEHIPRPFSVILTYGDTQQEVSKVPLYYPVVPRAKNVGKIGVGLIGAGGFAQSMHLPHLRDLSHLYDLRVICDRTGLKAKNVAQRFGAPRCTTDPFGVFGDESVDCVFITTRHASHAILAQQAAEAGKAVFVEKPMALHEEDLETLIEVVQKRGIPYMVGFNRRFAPLLQELKSLLRGRQEPMMVTYRMDVGHLFKDHWVYSDEGGGRIVGEGCHIIDLFRFLIGARPIHVDVAPLSKGAIARGDDNVAITVQYEDGSVATLVYTSLGDGKAGKEYCEIFADRKTYIVDDFRSWSFAGRKGSSRVRDKGHKAELVRFAAWLRGESGPPILFDEMVETTRLTFLIRTRLHGGG